MSTYNTFPNQQNDDEPPPPPPPHIYNSPLVSSALITAFGRPTLIEYDAPLLEFPEFTPLRQQTNHNRTHSLPQESQRHNTSNSRSLSKSSYLQEGHIAAYTYRITTTSSIDSHHLIMCQNPDGTYSHATDEDGPSSDEVKSNVPVDTITNLRQTMSIYEELPPHIHPTVPPEMIHPDYTSTAPPLKMWPLAILVFYNVSGGPFGIEPTIRAAGNFYAILGFVVFPLVWAIPEALVTAELGAAFQDPSAGVAWVEEAFGERWGGVTGYLGWIAGATDNVS
jgi:hypothetical protein